MNTIEQGQADEVELTVLEAVRTVQGATLRRVLPLSLKSQVTIEAIAAAAAKAARAEFIRRVKEVS